MNVDDLDIIGRKGFTEKRAADTGKPGGTVRGYQRDPLILSLMDRAQVGPGKLFADGGRRSRCRINDSNPRSKRPGYRGLEQGKMGAAKYGHIGPISRFATIRVLVASANSIPPRHEYPLSGDLSAE